LSAAPLGDVGEEIFDPGHEDGFVFPRLRQAGQLIATVDTLLLQHTRGRQLTDAILTGTTTQATSNTATREELAGYLAAFARMYEPHEAREDTVVFPAFRSLLSPEELTNLAATFAEIQGSMFGANAFGDILDQVVLRPKPVHTGTGLLMDSSLDRRGTSSRYEIGQVLTPTANFAIAHIRASRSTAAASRSSRSSDWRVRSLLRKLYLKSILYDLRNQRMGQDR
jgi:hypothetical protein